MKKIVLSSLITTMLLFSGTANAVAVLVTGGFFGVLAVAGQGFVGGTLALLVGAAGFSGGLGGLVELGDRGIWQLIAEKTESEGLATAAFVGSIFLDENRQVIEFKSIDPVHASDHGLTEAEVDIYNSGLPIINVVVDEFFKLHGDEVMTQQEAIAAFKKVAIAAGLSEECQVALSRVVTYQFKSS